MSVQRESWKPYGLSVPYDDGSATSPLHPHNRVASYLDRHPEARARYWNFDEHPGERSAWGSLLYFDVLALAEQEVQPQ